MNLVELREKLERGESLTPMEMALLEVALDEGADRPEVATLRAIEQDEPNLAWRSALNSRLAAIEASRRKRRFGRPLLAWSGALAVGACGALLVLAPWRQPDLGENEFAAMLIGWHEDAVAGSILPSDGIRAEDFRSSAGRSETAAIDELLYGGDALKTL